MIIRASTTAFVVILLAGSVAADDPYLDAARGVAHWVSASAVPTNDGLVWPAGPRDPKSIDTTLYTGTPGPILFLLELSRDTDDSAALTSARAGADALLASLSEEKGIYTITHDDAYLERSRKATALLLSKITRDNAGVRWVQAEHRTKPELLVAQTAYMQGASGVGLWLLHMGESTSGRSGPMLTWPDNPFVY